MKKIFFLIALIIFLLQISCKKDREEIPQEELPEIEEFVEFSQETQDLMFFYDTETGVIIFDSTSTNAQIESLSVGDILVCDECDVAPFGFFRRITEILSDEKQIYTEIVPLDEVINSGLIDLSFYVKPSENSNLKSQEGLFDFSFPFENEIVFDLDQNYSTTYDQILLNGLLEFNVWLEFTIHFSQGKVQYLRFEVEITEEFDAELSSVFDGNYFEKEKVVWKEKLPSFLVYVAGLPIRIRPVIEIVVGAEGNPSISNLILTQDSKLEIGKEYTHESWENILDLENNFSWEKPEVSKSFNLKGFAGPRLGLMLWDIIGPFGQADAFLSFESEGKQIYWYLYGGFESKVGVDMGIFSKKINNPQAEFELMKKEITGGVIEGSSEENPIAIFSVNPFYGTPETLFNFDASESYVPGDPGAMLWYRWDWDGDGLWDTDYITDKIKIHQFSQEGEYKVKLQVKNSSNLSDIDSTEITIFDTPNKIVFVRFFWSSSNYEIFSTNSDNSLEINLSNNQSGDINPCFSPDGKKIYFSSSRTGWGDIYSMNLDGSNLTRITNSDVQELHPSLSPGGTSLVYIWYNYPNGGKIMISNSDGSNSHSILDNGGYPYASCWSPTSDWIVFEMDGIHKIKSNGSGLTQLTTSGRDPCWNPSGTKIYYVVAEQNNSNIWVMNSDGSNQVRITSTLYIESHPSVSPDGAKIIFSKGVFGAEGIWIMNIDGSNPQPLIESFAEDKESIWNPNP